MNGQLKGLLMAFAGIVILSPDTLLVRLLDLPQWPLQFYRGLGMALVITLLVAVLSKGRIRERFLAIGKTGLLTAVFHASSSLLFISSLYLTSVANTLAIISSAPVFGAVFSSLVNREHLPLRTWLAAFAAMGCICLIVAGGLGGDQATILGDFLALLQAMCMAASFGLVRRKQNVDMLPAIALGGVLMALVSLPLAGAPAIPEGAGAMLALLCLGVLPVSFALLFWAPRFIPAPEVNMIMLLEMVLGPLLVWVVVGEAVPRNTLIGGGLLFVVLLGHSLFTVLHYRRQTRGLREAMGGG
jgi:drug/metabolite transporter (DMT)-like permease